MTDSYRQRVFEQVLDCFWRCLPRAGNANVAAEADNATGHAWPAIHHLHASRRHLAQQIFTSSFARHVASDFLCFFPPPRCWACAESGGMCSPLCATTPTPTPATGAQQSIAYLRVPAGANQCTCSRRKQRRCHLSSPPGRLVVLLSVCRCCGSTCAWSAGLSDARRGSRRC